MLLHIFSSTVCGFAKWVPGQMFTLFGGHGGGKFGNRRLRTRPAITAVHFPFHSGGRRTTLTRWATRTKCTRARNPLVGKEQHLSAQRNTTHHKRPWALIPSLLHVTAF